jgi:transcription elongation factor Elf1
MNSKDWGKVREIVDSSIRQGIDEYKKSAPHMFDCPECKHETMAFTPYYNYPTHPIWGYTTAAIIDTSTTCLNCGKRFKKETGTKWVEVTE